MGNKEQIYGRNDMVMLDKHNKIYGSLGIVEPYVFDTKTGETIVMENPKKGKFEDVVTEFSAYGKSTQVTTTGAQLLDTKNLITGYYDGKGNVVELPQRISTPKIQIPTGKEKISISGLSENISIIYVIQNAENVVIDRKEGYKKQHTVSLSAEVKTIGISFYIDDTTMVTADMLDTCMINFGDIKPYEPYTGGKPSPSIEYPQEIVSVGDKGNVNIQVKGNVESVQNLLLHTPNGLFGIPVSTGGNYTDANGQQWVTDEIDLAREKYVQRIYITEINESMIKSAKLNWEKEDKISYRITINLLATKRNKRCLSNRFVWYLYPYFVAISNDLIYFEFVDKKEMPTVEKFKQFLTNNKTTVAYILETPIEHNLTPEEVETYKALHTNYPTTVIMNDENARMKVTYKQLESKTRVVN